MKKSIWYIAKLHVFAGFIEFFCLCMSKWVFY